MKSVHLLISALLVLMLSCTPPHLKKMFQLEQVLHLAGDNRYELEKVLEHYRANGDPLKLKAAEFLITNMAEKFSYQGGNIERYDIMFHLFDSLYHSGMYVGETLAITNAWDSLEQHYGFLSPEELEMKWDMHHITADYLIRHIDVAFEAWQSSPAYLPRDFVLFCEHILPYRFGNEPLEEFRERYFRSYRHLVDTASSINSLIDGFYQEFRLNQKYRESLTLWNYPIDVPISKMELGHRGSCRHLVNFAALAMRSCGLPVTVDRVIWANRSQGHEWNVLLLDSGKFEYFDAFDRKMEFAYQPAKIFRERFRSSYDNKLDPNDVPPQFLTSEEDVTSLYFDVYDVTVPVQYAYLGNKRKKYGVICTFDNQEWKVVYWGTILKNKMTFRDMNSEVVYLAAYYDNGHIIPATEPFLLQEDGSLHFHKTDGTYQDMTLTRKYPLFRRILFLSDIVRSTNIEGANRADFSDKQVFHTFERVNSRIHHIRINNQQKFRYIRFIAGKDRPGNYAEIEFYGKVDEYSPEERLTGKIIGMPAIKPDDPYPYTNAFDGNPETWFEKPKDIEGWAGLDLGKGNERIITRVRFYPRSDTNFILIGDTYELFYWENEVWKSAGRKVADADALTYKDIPSGTIYWLRNLTRGKEERIFTYEDGKQVWW